MSVEDMANYAKHHSKGISRTVTAEQLMAKANDGLVTGKVGWEGNFNDMAIKTVVRRLLSKYGYLSVEMQSAMSGDIEAEQSQADRDNTIDVSANAQTLDVDTAPVETVDTETGEILAAPQAGTAAKAKNEPGYYSLRYRERDGCGVFGRRRQRGLLCAARFRGVTRNRVRR